jgi:predicted branched-subunit amino acid permease
MGLATEDATLHTSPDESTPDLRAARRTLVLSGLAFVASAAGTSLVYGITARGAGLSPIETLAMSTIVLGGASQFAAVGLLAQGVGWLGIVLLTAFLNARHLLYSAAIAPWMAKQPRIHRAAMAHVLTDETFGLSVAHFRSIGRFDGPGYWIAAALVCLPWIVGSMVGYFGSGAIPDPTVLGLDIVFPAAMAGLAVGLVSGRRDVAAAVAGAVVAVLVGLAISPSVGVVVGGIVGPLAAFLVPTQGQDEPLGGGVVVP